MIFLDMDGVIVDWFGAAMKKLGIKEYPCPGYAWLISYLEERGLDGKKFWEELGRDWYAGLQWTGDGREILRECERSGSVMICTSYTDNGGCLAGKLDWIQREMPKYSDRIVFTRQKFLCNRSRNDILIDDFDDNIMSWDQVRGGGQGILVPRIWNSLGSVDTMKYVKQELKRR